jgi:hypothetical protein
LTCTSGRITKMSVKEDNRGEKERSEKKGREGTQGKYLHWI